MLGMVPGDICEYTTRALAPWLARHQPLLRVPPPATIVVPIASIVLKFLVRWTDKGHLSRHCLEWIPWVSSCLEALNFVVPAVIRRTTPKVLRRQVMHPWGRPPQKHPGLVTTCKIGERGASLPRRLPCGCMLLYTLCPQKFYELTRLQHPNDFKFYNSDNLYVKILLLEFEIMGKYYEWIR